MGRTRSISWNLPALAVAVALGILCFSGLAVAEDVTYDESTVISWEASGRTFLGPTGVESSQTTSISGNTVTIQNVTAPGQNSSQPFYDIRVYGGANSTDSSAVTGNTVVLDNATLDYQWVEDDYIPDESSTDPDSVAAEVIGGLGLNYSDFGNTGTYTYDHTVNPAANNNTVEIKSGSIVGEVTGGVATFSTIPDSGNPITLAATATANSNTVEIKGGSTVGEVKGGDTSVHMRTEPNDSITGTATATASENRVIIEAGTVGEVYAGDAHVSASYTVEDSTTTLGLTATALVKDNTIEINGNSTVVESEIWAGHSSVTGIFATGTISKAEGNAVIINAGTVETEDDAIAGGVAVVDGYYITNPEGPGPIYIPDNQGSALATGNSVTINGGTVTLKETANPDNDDAVGIVGGIAQSDTGSATATGNTLAITGGTVKVEGGYGLGGGGAGSISSGAATATQNTVAITGGTVQGNVYGGYAVSVSGKAAATGNTVTVGGTANLSAASLHGGGSDAHYADAHADNDFFTGNILNIHSAAAIRDARNFQFVNFHYNGAANIGTLDTTGGEVALNTGSHAIAFGGAVTGTGSLKKSGSGALTLGGSISIGGKLTIGEGTLALSRNVSAAAGGGVTFASGSQFTPNGNKLSVTGAVTVDSGAILNLSASDRGHAILSGSGGILGMFDSLFYDTELRNSTEIWVVGSRSTGNIVADLANSGVTMGPNGAKGIGAINKIVNSMEGALKDNLIAQLEAIVDLADSGNVEAASTALQQVIGQYSGKGMETAQATAQNFAGAVFGHMSQMRDARTALRDAPIRGNGALASVSSGRRLMDCYFSPANRIWAGGFGAFTRQDDRDGTDGYRYDAGGLILGYDRLIGDNVTLGFTGAYSRGRLKGNEGYSKTDIDTMNLGLYASYDPRSGFYAEGNIGLGFTWNRERESLITGGGHREGKYRTTSFQTGGNVGYAFLLPAAFRVIPTVGVQFIRAHQSDYAQTGAGLPMWRDSASANYVEIPFAARINKTFDLGSGMSLTPEARAAWICEAKKDSPTVRTGYVGSGEAFMLSGTNPGRHRGLIGAGVKARLGGTVDAFVDYNLEFRNRYQNHNVMAGVGVSF